MKISTVASISIAIMFTALCFAPMASAEDDEGEYYPWSMSNGDAGHSGVSPYIIDEMPEDVLWDRSIDGTPSWPLATGPDGTIYVTNGNEIEAMNSDGQWLWVYKADGTVSSSIAIDANGSACFTVAAEGSKAQTLVMIDDEGNELWSIALTYEVASGSDMVTRNVRFTSSPVIGPVGRIYMTALASTTLLGSEDHYVFDEVVYNGSSASVTGRDLAISEVGRNIADPAVSVNGVLLFANLDSVYAIDPEEGFLWKFTSSSGSELSDLSVDESGHCYFMSGGVLYSLNAGGSLRWTYGPFDQSASIAAVSSIGVYVEQTSNGSLRSVTRVSDDGSMLWTYDVGVNATDSGAVVVDQTGFIVICGTEAIIGVYANGTEAWSSDVAVADDESTVRVFTSAVIGDNDTIYMIACDNGYYLVYSIGNWLDAAVYNLVLLVCLSFAPFFIVAACYIYFKEDEKK